MLPQDYETSPWLALCVLGLLGLAWCAPDHELLRSADSFRQRYTRSADDVDLRPKTQTQHPTAKRGVSIRAVTFFSAEIIFL